MILLITSDSYQKKIQSGSDYKAATAQQLIALAEEMNHIPTVKHPEGAETGCVFLGNFGVGGGEVFERVKN
jgi:hypothetical protein